MMERTLHREDHKNGSLTIEITDASHFIDSLNEARRNEKEEDFCKAMMRLIIMAMSAAIPRREFKDTEVHFEGQPGKEHKLIISPDSHRDPSFFWKEEKGMHGGLIWHDSSKSWGIHT